MRLVYCPVCGRRLGERLLSDEGRVPWCDGCGRPWFDAFAACVIVLAVNGEGEIALIQQSYPLDMERFVCVAGYMKPGESAEDAAERELSEELGLKPQAVRYLGSYPFPERDQLMLGFACAVQKAAFRLSAEVRHAEWFSPEEARLRLENSRIARLLLEEYLRQKSG